MIGRLSDGNCWLLDNLRLDPLDSTVRGRMSSSNTNASDTAINSFKYGGGTASDQYAMYPVANGASDSKYATPLVNTKNKNKTGVSYAGKYGVHYNFCAASAGSYCYGNDNSSDDDGLTGNPTEDATEDICPKGWHLPIGGNTTENGSFSQLGRVMDGNGNLQTGNDGKAASRKWRSYPNNFLYSGYQYNSRADGRSHYSVLWSSTAFAAARAFYMYFGGSIASPGTNADLGKQYGYTIRCVANS